MLENTYVLFGRVTCPWTRRFARQLPQFSDKTIYYIDTENTDLDPELAAIRKAYGVITVPAFFKRGTDGNFVKFDSSQETLEDFMK